MENIKNMDSVRKESLQQQTHRILKKAILSGQLQKNKVYSINQIAQIFNVSRTPVGSAVQSLSEEGLIKILPNQGFKISEFSEDEVKELFELRGAIEGYIVEKVIEINADISEARRHLEAQKNYIDKANVSLFLKESRCFHEALAKKLNNHWILQCLQNNRDLLTLMDLEVMNEPKRAEQAIKEHTNILKAIENKDKIIARKALNFHFDKVVNLLIKRIRKV